MNRTGQDDVPGAQGRAQDGQPVCRPDQGLQRVTENVASLPGRDGHPVCLHSDLLGGQIPGRVERDGWAGDDAGAGGVVSDAVDERDVPAREDGVEDLEREEHLHHGRTDGAHVRGSGRSGPSRKAISVSIRGFMKPARTRHPPGATMLGTMTPEPGSSMPICSCMATEVRPIL
ncbi:hypothetical protein ACFU6M_19450 [Streptomyces bottropensis]|uniref:hypothetical protein n=1 Tax=Streptomyces bottropensis TaxID=42235 RepID=UPI0036A209FC